MKRQLLVLAAAIVVLAACHNSGSSTVAEKDPAYQQSFAHNKAHEGGEHHSAPASEPAHEAGKNNGQHTAPAQPLEPAHQGAGSDSHSTTDTAHEQH